MLNQVETQVNNQVISLSTTAAQAVQDIMKEKQLKGYALRIYVSGGGCCGTQFGMALDDNVREIDTTFETEGVKLVVDEISIDHLRGSRIDYVDDPERGAGFVVNNPNVSEHNHNHSSDACACGGSCACNS